jgi:hypothetical protein
LEQERETTGEGIVELDLERDSDSGYSDVWFSISFVSSHAIKILISR